MDPDSDPYPQHSLEGPCSLSDSNMDSCKECCVVLSLPDTLYPGANSISILNAHTLLSLECNVQGLAHRKY
jgi:hypothetical protein